MVKYFFGMYSKFKREKFGNPKLFSYIREILLEIIELGCYNIK